MARKVMRKEYVDISLIINEIADEINTVLGNKQKEMYFKEIVLLYSFIENLLNWLAFVKTLWEKSYKQLTQEDVKRLKSFYRRLNLYNALNISFCIGLIDLNLYVKIDAIRKERNNVIHQFWIYVHRNNLLVLRKKLEKLAGVANQLVVIFNLLTKEIGVEEVNEMFLYVND